VGTSLRNAEHVLPPWASRSADAEAWLGGVLKTWGVRASSTGRWLSGAQDALQGEAELVLFAQYDEALLLFTVEIWRSGRRIYGIDDWLG
jgi:hypothetical protein